MSGIGTKSDEEKKSSVLHFELMSVNRTSQNPEVFKGDGSST